MVWCITADYRPKNTNKPKYYVIADSKKEAKEKDEKNPEPDTKTRRICVPTGLENYKLLGTNGHTYLLQRKIGKGYFASVYRSVDLNDPEKAVYACKVISKKELDEKEYESIKSAVDKGERKHRYTEEDILEEE